MTITKSPVWGSFAIILAVDYDYSPTKKQICVLVGAGMSANAGIPTFRGEGGSWRTDEIVRQAFDIDNFVSNLGMRQALWRWLANSPAWQAKPTRAHWLLKQLDDAGYLISVMTQNFDMLEKKAGIRQGKIRQLHGRMDRSVCLACRRYFDTKDLIMAPLVDGEHDLKNDAVHQSPSAELDDYDLRCPDCGGIIKPDIVFFGEPLDEMMLKYIGGMDLPACDELWCIGSSLAVYPAASIPLQAKRQYNKRVVIVSTDKTEMDTIADEIIRQPADIAVSLLVERTIG